MVKKVKLRLGELLVQANLITEEQLNEALENKDAGQRLGDYLTEQGQITDVQLAEVLKEQLGYPHIRLHNYEFDTSLLKLIPKDYVREKSIIPLKREKNKLFLAISDPLDYFTINDVRLSTGFEVEPVIVTKSEIRQAILALYEQEDFTDELEEQYQETKGTDLTIEEESSPIVKILNQLFQQAVVQKASDIHIDPQETKVVVRLRMDGALHTEQTFSKGVQASMVTRVKIMAGLDITEQKIPQDGRIKLNIEGRKVDFRVSTLPTIFGEKVVIRVLGPLEWQGPVTEPAANSAFRLAQVWQRYRVPEQLCTALAAEPGPVLLVDDFATTKWSLTVAAVRLREAGAAAVLPLTLGTI